MVTGDSITVISIITLNDCRPESIELCKRENCEFWLLGSGAFGKVIDLKYQPNIFEHGSNVSVDVFPSIYISAPIISSKLPDSMLSCAYFFDPKDEKYGK